VGGGWISGYFTDGLAFWTTLWLPFPVFLLSLFFLEVLGSGVGTAFTLTRFST